MRDGQEGELAVWELNTVARTGEMLSILLIQSMAEKFLHKPFWQIWNKKINNKAAEISYRNTGNNFVSFCYICLTGVLYKNRGLQMTEKEVLLSLWAAGDMCI